MNFEEIEAVVAVLRGNPALTEIDLRQGETRLRLRRPGGAMSVGVATTPARKASPIVTPTPPTAATTVVRAQVVGVFRSAITVGEAVTEGQVLGQIETMGLPNDCLAPAAGSIQAIRVGNGQPVEYGQPLFEIEENSNASTT
jgi:biotin carboxyl carrier protein